MESTLLLFDFDGVYRTQNFYTQENCRWIHKKHMPGVCTYCDPQARNQLRERIKNIGQPVLAFLGSGNYHYITFFLTEKIREDFALVLCDHHSDMKPPAFGSLLSCGNWLRQAMEQLPHLKQIVLVGVNDSELAELPNSREITIFPGSTISGRTDWVRELEQTLLYPVYFSVDKDVFSQNAAWTNWNQGTMELHQFSEAFCAVAESHRVVGMDVCGEFPAIYGNLFESNEANQKNNQANRGLLELWKQHLSGPDFGK
ncbi:MAG: arginase family protein [Clostridiales bacterium]|nr:arginase family protein [Clostridiales bacterium]